MNDSTPFVEPHLHWEFGAFDVYEGDLEGAATVHWAVRVQVDGYESEADALIAAKALVTRRYFKLKSVWECQTCGIQRRMVKVLEDART